MESRPGAAPILVGPGRLRFTHALIRDVVYERIPAGRRPRLHQRAGEVLEALHRQDLDLHLAELAHHFFEAAPGGDAGKAVSYARRAGERAIALLAYEEAARLFRMALAALGPGQSPEEDRARCRLLLALGDALTRMGFPRRGTALGRERVVHRMRLARHLPALASSAHGAARLVF